MATIQNQFIHAVVNGFFTSESPQNNSSNNTITWMQEYLFNANASQEEVDNFARGILSDLNISNHSKNQKRYKFHPLPAHEELLKALFDKSFEHQPEAVIAEAQKVQGSLYPLWKRVCLIHLPKAAAAILDNILVKVAVGIAACYFSYVVGSRASYAMIHFSTARAIPFFINNTPIAVIRAGNTVMDAKDWVYNHMLPILLGACIVQQAAIRGPQIPYITAAANRISIWDVWNFLRPSPVGLFGFIVSTSWDTVKFVGTSCNTASGFFRYIAIQTENERLAVCQAKAYNVWKKLMSEHIPKNRPISSQLP